MIFNGYRPPSATLRPAVISYCETSRSTWIVYEVCLFDSSWRMLYFHCVITGIVINCITGMQSVGKMHCMYECVCVCVCVVSIEKSEPLAGVWIVVSPDPGTSSLVLLLLFGSRRRVKTFSDQRLRRHKLLVSVWIWGRVPGHLFVVNSNAQQPLVRKLSDAQSCVLVPKRDSRTEVAIIGHL